ncbi:MAG: hypothetical protein K2K02_08390 [Ruminococcus sp.]|nr:hypothetical protein [Ruminococcus sp.]
MHYSGAINLIFLIFAIVEYIMFPIALIFLFRIARPISNCHIIKNFRKYERSYGKTTATLYSDHLYYTVDKREFSVKLPYYIHQETINVIYMKRKPHKVIVECPELWHKVIVKNLITSATIFISGFVILKIMVGLMHENKL